LYMAGGVFSGLTSQTTRPLSCGSDTISSRNPARPHTSDRYCGIWQHETLTDYEQR
jgi:hypothetical protein